MCNGLICPAGSRSGFYQIAPQNSYFTRSLLDLVPGEAWQERDTHQEWLLALGDVRDSMGPDGEPVRQ